MSNDDSEFKPLSQLIGPFSDKLNPLALLSQKTFNLYCYFILFLHICSTPPKINNFSEKLAPQNS